METLDLKQPLQRTWCLWTDTNWDDLRNRGFISTVLELVQLSNNLARVSSMEHKQNIRIFEKGVEPKREDIANRNGGQWSIQFFRNVNIDDEFIYLLLDICNENMGDFDIKGFELNVRNRGHRISIWTSEFKEDFGIELNKRFHEDNGVFLICYKKHEDIMLSDSTFNVTPLQKLVPQRPVLRLKPLPKKE